MEEFVFGVVELGILTYYMAEVLWVIGTGHQVCVCIVHSKA
jgi:hypothetical protein